MFAELTDIRRANEEYRKSNRQAVEAVEKTAKEKQECMEEAERSK